MLVDHCARGSVARNQIHSNGAPGVRIASQADPSVTDNTIYNGHHCGVLVSDGGRGTIQGNAVMRNRRAGIKVKSEAAPRVRGNRVHHGFGAGVHVAASGGGLLESNACFSNEGADLRIEAPPGQCAARANGGRAVEASDAFARLNTLCAPLALSSWRSGSLGGLVTFHPASDLPCIRGISLRPTAPPPLRRAPRI